MLDGAAAMLQGNVEAEEGCHKVRAEIVLKAWLLNAHPLPAKAKEQPYVGEEVLPRHLLQRRPLSVELYGCGHPCLEL